jgi:hypothetical protein
MVRLLAIKKVLTIIRLPIADIARLVRFPTLDLEWEWLNKLPQFLPRRPDFSDRHLELANVSAFHGRRRFPRMREEHMDLTFALNTWAPSSSMASVHSHLDSTVPSVLMAL